MGFMVVRAEETKKVFLDEIALLLIENPAVSLTGCLLEALVEKKIRVVFCDAKRTPNAELVPYYNAYDCSRKIKAQMAWTDDLKGAVWADIVAEKIRKQADFLDEIGKSKEPALHGFRVLLLENTARRKLKNIKRYIVDEDLCEF